MAGPLVRLVPPGSFARWMAGRGRAGGQNKVPRVLADDERLGHFDRGAGTRSRRSRSQLDLRRGTKPLTAAASGRWHGAHDFAPYRSGRTGPCSLDRDVFEPCKDHPFDDPETPAPRRADGDCRAVGRRRGGAAHRCRPAARAVAGPGGGRRDRGPSGEFSHSGDPFTLADVGQEESEVGIREAQAELFPAAGRGSRRRRPGRRGGAGRDAPGGSDRGALAGRRAGARRRRRQPGARTDLCPPVRRHGRRSTGGGRLRRAPGSRKPGSRSAC